VLTFLGDRSKYVGQFREGAMHGRGAVVRADGSVVQSGQYEAGVLRQPDPPPVAARPSAAPLPALPGAATAPASAPAAVATPAGAAPTGPATAAGPRAPVPAATPTPGFAVGRVTMPDRSPLTGDVKDIAIGLSGISAAGERVSYGPEVGADGRYRQRIAPGQYRFGGSQLTVRLGEREFRLPLEPVGERWNRNRDAAEGIVQDFVWKTTGLTPYGRASGPDPNNHTHWYGVHVRVAWQTWRADTRKPTVPPPPRHEAALHRPAGLAHRGRAAARTLRRRARLGPAHGEQGPERPAAGRPRDHRRRPAARRQQQAHAAARRR
jgi:hypothetical protein